MNKTQKGALFSLVNFLVLIIFSVHSTKIIRDIFSPEGYPNALKIVLFWAFLIFGFMALSALLLYRRKQSSTEVESDERDDLIKKKSGANLFHFSLVFANRQPRNSVAHCRTGRFDSFVHTTAYLSWSIFCCDTCLQCGGSDSIRLEG